MPQPIAPEVEIDVGEVTPTAQDARFSTGSDSAAIWTDYFIQCRLEKDYHRFMIGVSSPRSLLGISAGPSVAIVQLTAPTVCWVADWTAARSQSKPKIPAPGQLAASLSTASAGGGTQWIILDERLEPNMVAAEPNGKAPMYRINGTYVYGALNPDLYLNRDAVFPLPPWLDKTAFDRDVSDDMFEQGLINTTNANPQ